MSLDQAPLSDRLKSKSDTNLARYTLFQQITDEAPLTPEKVLFLSQKAQKRRDADSTLKYGFEKYLSGDAPNKTEAMEKLEEVKAKIFILNRCLQNYKAIEVSEGRNLYESTREKVSGTLDVTVLEVTGVPTRNRKRIISVRIDNTEKLDVRLKTKQTISLSGAQDFEICFSESGSGISAFQFFPIADFIADAFKTRDPANSKPTEYTKKVWINLLPAGQAHMLLTFSIFIFNTS